MSEAALKPIRRPKGKATDAEIEAALIALARNSGNQRRTGRELGLAHQTIATWRKDHAERYAEIQQQVIPEIRARVAERQAEIAEELADAEQKALRETVASLPELDHRDKANALRSISTSKGITLQHLNAYQAPPADPNAGSVSEVFDKLAKHGLLVRPVEAEAEDVMDAQVVEATSSRSTRSDQPNAPA